MVERGEFRSFLRNLYAPDPRVRFEAVLGLGALAEAKHEERPESVRELARRFVWALSDEAGATAWGAPEALGEILTRVPSLQEHFAPLLLGFLVNEDVCLGNEVLDAGALWAIGRIGPGTPVDTAETPGVLRSFLSAGTPTVKGAAAFAAGRLGTRELREPVAALLDDPTPLVLPVDGVIVESTVGSFALAALAALGG